MDQSRTSSRSSARSPKAMYTLLSETPRDYSGMCQLGRQEPSLFSICQNRQRPLAAVLQLQRTSPFKQAVQGSRLQVKSDVPSAALKEKFPSHPGENLMARTERSVEQVRQQILADEAEIKPRKTNGRLMKGHLQPMRIVRMAGPPIETCCGILPQKAINTFGVTASVQRRGLIIANLDTTRQLYDTLLSQYESMANQQHPAHSGHRHYRPDTSESIHRTSIASDDELETLGRDSDGSGSERWMHEETDDVEEEEADLGI